MKYVLIGACVLFCGQAVAQQPAEYDLKITADELNVISEALGTQPFNKVVNLMGKLRQQVMQQQMPKPVPPVEPEKK